MATCDKCGQHETDAWYEYHYGAHVRTEPAGSYEVTWYSDIRQGGAHVCSRCGNRHVMLRYLLPFALVPLLVVATAYGPAVELSTYLVLAVVLAALTASVGPAAWWCVQHAAARSRRVILPVLGLALVWATGTFGLIGSFALAIASAEGDLSGWPEVFLWLPVTAQLVLLWFLWRERSILVETLAWRLHKTRLRRAGTPAWRSGLRGWNSYQSSQLRKPR
ncbi:hypothetical protein ACTMTJ_09440 [Phytohabitans sp. LJ34]|uniref:hypothetical protein n=1 Tax=Phytohabitans sp. LJ34 TaxID=3452217 RepID=UPI003F8A0CFE